MKALRKNIKKVLSEITEDSSPNVYKAIQTEIGYKNIEDKMINLMIDNGVRAAETIVYLEQMY